MRARQLHRRTAEAKSSRRTSRRAGRWPATSTATTESTPSSTCTRRRCDGNPRADHRLRLEHVGAIRPDQFRRAAELGVTCSLFVDQLHYWGDVWSTACSGRNTAHAGCPAASAVAAGMRISLHNDAPVTPEEPLRNISVAVTRPGAQRPGARARGAADRRAGHPGADHRRGLAVVRRRRDRLAGGRQSTPTWWCCRPTHAPCRPSRSPTSRCVPRSSPAARSTGDETGAAPPE